ncbi:MAG: hypothetical protein P4L44_01750 [Oryzomonas sp.]|uniref:hypothetical protein n=1 Tax=Oryzomonas sp. TaxID=2855186 RepID=UPI00284E35C2|nr:hypothetical protein [Oryzomonas sp.]MDR3578667.1 hypothetical protein [Oryzomonas sp.]
MTIERAYCEQCGREIQDRDNPDLYSVKVDRNGFLLEIVNGELVAGSHHYCSGECMFRRKQGVFTEEDIITYHFNLE